VGEDAVKRLLGLDLAAVADLVGARGLFVLILFVSHAAELTILRSLFHRILLVALLVGPAWHGIASCASALANPGFVCQSQVVGHRPERTTEESPMFNATLSGLITNAHTEVGHPVQILVTWDEHDPVAIHMSFAPEGHLDSIDWVFGRALLMEAFAETDRWVGDGDVTLRAMFTGQLKVQLVSPEGTVRERDRGPVPVTIWHSTAERAPTHWVGSERLPSGLIRFEIFEGTTRNGSYIELTLSDALDFADQITKQASL
jgi:hypothetical protein